MKGQMATDKLQKDELQSDNTKREVKIKLHKHGRCRKVKATLRDIQKKNQRGHEHLLRVGPALIIHSSSPELTQ